MNMPNIMIGRRSTAFKVTICGRDGLKHRPFSDVTHIMSLLDPGRPMPKELAELQVHQRAELWFHDIIEPEPGAVVPRAEHVERLLAFCRHAITSGSRSQLLIHCRAGLSRSPAAALLCLIQARPDRTAVEALGEIVRMQPEAWPNLRLLELGDEALGRNGEIVAAAGAHYRRRLDAHPNLGDHLRRCGRAREVMLANCWR